MTASFSRKCLLRKVSNLSWGTSRRITFFLAGVMHFASRRAIIGLTEQDPVTWFRCYPNEFTIEEKRHNSWKADSSLCTAESALEKSVSDGSDRSSDGGLSARAWCAAQLRQLDAQRRVCTLHACLSLWFWSKRKADFLAVYETRALQRAVFQSCVRPRTSYLSFISRVIIIVNHGTYCILALLAQPFTNLTCKI